MMEDRVEYEWVRGIKYYDRIYAFLKEIDNSMIPRISDRVGVEDYAQKLSERAETIFWIVEGTDVGSCSVYCDREVAFISSIAVKKEFLQQNIGTKVMVEVKQHARECGCRMIRLEVHQENSAALCYYKKNVFVGQNIHGAWITMECELNETTEEAQAWKKS